MTEGALERKRLDHVVLPRRLPGLALLERYFPSPADNVLDAELTAFAAAGDTVLDPWSGTGWTARRAVSHGMRVVAAEASPFAQMAAQAYLLSPEVAAVDAAFAHAAEAGRGVLGTLRFGTTPAARHEVRPTLLARLRSEHPGIAVDVSEATTGNLCRELLSRRLDVAPGFCTDAVPGLVRRTLLHERVHVLMRAARVDPVALHVEQTGPSLAGASVGDARSLSFDDASADAVLLLGTLYHLIEGPERAAALREAARVVRPDGVVVARFTFTWSFKVRK